MILKGVQSDLNEDIKPLEEQVQVIHFILHFVQSLCQDIALKTSSECTKGPNLIIFNLLEVMKDELRPSMLASSSFKMPLDLNETINGTCSLNFSVTHLLLVFICLSNDLLYLYEGV